MTVKCEICGRNFKNRAGLAGHKQFCHGEVERHYVAKQSEVLQAIKEAETRQRRRTQVGLTFETLLLSCGTGLACQLLFRVGIGPMLGIIVAVGVVASFLARKLLP